MSEPLTPIETLERQLRERLPSAIIRMDRPRKTSGVWFLDVTLNEHRVEIQWQNTHGFGVSSPESRCDFGEGPDEVFPNEEAAYGRVISLLLSGTFTSPPEPVRLRELRKEQGLSQAELAGLLNKQQGEISKIERRSDVLVSTLRDYVRSIGAEMQIIVRLPDGRERSLELGESLPSPESRQHQA